MAYKLIISEIDSVLRFSYDEPEPRVNVGNKLKELAGDVQICFVTNAGGYAVRRHLQSLEPDQRWKDPNEYPTHAKMVQEVDDAIYAAMGSVYPVALAKAYAMQRRGEWHELPVPEEYRLSEDWSIAWRLPNAGMLIHFMDAFDTIPSETLVVYGSGRLLQAGRKIGCPTLGVLELV